MLQEFADRHKNVCFVMSLGLKRYLSALNCASFVLGNSSSGLIEAPSFGIPTINVGNRQKGRLKADSVIDCDTKAEDIVNAVRVAMTEEFRTKAQNTVNPYGDGHTSKKVVEIIKKNLFKGDIHLLKKFYNIDFEI